MSAQTLDFSSTGATSGLPKEWGLSFKALQTLDVSNNALSSSIPTT